MKRFQKVAIIGLDCAEPSLVFDRWLDRLPNLRRLVESGLHGRLESCMPPITVPAWSCMSTGLDPGTLGVYGFRNRVDHSYDRLGIATNAQIHAPRVWDVLGDSGRSSITVGVPQTYPILRPPPGVQVTCFLTPGIDSQYTHPPELRNEIADWVGEYMVDVRGFRSDDKAWLLEQIYQMTDRRFTVCRRLLETRPWDLFWMVEMGVDRIHHGFWQYMDSKHHRHVPGDRFEHAIRDYYVHLDARIGELLAVLDLSTTLVMVVSDHGAKRMDGGVCFNDWLIRQGCLAMRTPVDARRKFEFGDVDWSRTRAWGEGGYYGRLFINRVGREPQGLVPAEEYERFRSQLIEEIERMPGPDGKPLGNRAYRPEDIYREVNGVAPDLIVIFGDLHWRSVGTIGNPDIYTQDNDTGPDDANHAQHGLYVLSHPTISRGRRDASLYDIAPTVLDAFGLAPPGKMVGRSLLQ